jgi:hypothetical protein
MYLKLKAGRSELPLLTLLGCFYFGCLMTSVMQDPTI